MVFDAGSLFLMVLATFILGYSALYYEQQGAASEIAGRVKS